MKLLKKSTLAMMVGAAAFTVATAANAEIMLANKKGWQFSTDGQINQFYTYTKDRNGGNSSDLHNGLLPGFLGFNVTGPEVEGLTVGARISISPSTDGHSYSTDGGGAFEQREAYLTVDGSFGQVLAGKALGLYGSHNLLTEQTLYGVGYGAQGNGTTTLGGIGLGYDYADWRSQLRWTSPDMNGFKLAFALVDPQGPALRLGANGNLPTGPIGDSDESGKSPRYEGDLSYAGAFDNGSYLLWVSGMQQDHDSLSEDASAWTVGSTLKMSGVELMAQYSDSKDSDASNNKLEWSQYIVQAGYRFSGTTLVSVNYSELKDDSPNATNGADKSDRITAGVYHNVTKNLKLVAEYTHVENDDQDLLDQDIYSVGGFVSW